jgi:hypothetical protein
MKECQLTLSSPIQKSEMFSGTWYIVIEGPDFAYMRMFYLTVDVPTTIIVGRPPPLSSPHQKKNHEY